VLGDTQAASQLRVGDILIAHCQVKRQLRGKPKWDRRWLRLAGDERRDFLATRQADFKIPAHLDQQVAAGMSKSDTKAEP
jgi:hypothetical protein